MFTVSSLSSPSRSSVGRASSARSCRALGRAAYTENTAPGRKAPERSRWTRRLRSSAWSSREVVDLANPSSSTSEVNVRGSLDSTTSVRSAFATIDCSLWSWSPLSRVPVSGTLVSLDGARVRPRQPLVKHVWRPHVPELDASLRAALGGGARDPGRRLAAAGQRDRCGVRLRPRARAVPGGRAEGRGERRPLRPRVRHGTGGQGAARVRRAGPQPGQHGAHGRRRDGVRQHLRGAVRARGRSAPGRDHGGLPQLLQAGAELHGHGLGGRGDRRAGGHAAGLPAPRHDLRAADGHRQDLHGQRRVQRERRATPWR